MAEAAAVTRVIRTTNTIDLVANLALHWVYSSAGHIPQFLYIWLLLQPCDGLPGC